MLECFKLWCYNRKIVVLDLLYVLEAYNKIPKRYKKVKTIDEIQGEDMTILMIVISIIAYILLWFLIIKCNNIIKKTGEAGNSSRDIIKNQND